MPRLPEKGLRPSAEIPDAAIRAATEGVTVGIQGTRPIFEIVYKGVRQRIAVTVGNNGFVVGANPLLLQMVQTAIR